MKNQKTSGNTLFTIVGIITITALVVVGVIAIIDHINGPGTVKKFVQSLGDPCPTANVVMTNNVFTNSSPSNIQLPVDTQLVTVNREGTYIFIMTKPRPLSEPATTYKEYQYEDDYDHTLVGKLLIVEQ